MINTLTPEFNIILDISLGTLSLLPGDNSFIKISFILAVRRHKVMLCGPAQPHIVSMDGWAL